MKHGLSLEIVNALTEGRRLSSMSESEETVYDFCDELRRNHSVTDPTYARALSKFGEQGIIEIVSAYGCYSYLSMIMNMARTPLPKSAGPLRSPCAH